MPRHHSTRISSQSSTTQVPPFESAAHFKSQLINTLRDLYGIVGSALVTPLDVMRYDGPCGHQTRSSKDGRGDATRSSGDDDDTIILLRIPSHAVTAVCAALPLVQLPQQNHRLQVDRVATLLHCVL